MCLAIPGKIIKIEGDIATIDYGSEKREAKIISQADDGSSFNIGDFVLVQAKIVSEKVPEEQVAGWLEYIKNTTNSPILK